MNPLSGFIAVVPEVHSQSRWKIIGLIYFSPFQYSVFVFPFSCLYVARSVEIDQRHSLHSDDRINIKNNATHSWKTGQYEIVMAGLRILATNFSSLAFQQSI